MQVRSLPALIPPQRSTQAPQRAVTPVAAQDERSQLAPPVPRTIKRQSSADQLLQAEQRQRYSYTRLEAEGSRTSRALQTYYNIETQDEQARSQALFGIDILA